MSRLLNRTTQVVIDLAVLSIALWTALFVRFDGNPPVEMATRVLIQWPYAVGLQYAALVAFGVHRYQWRYVGLREATRILCAIGCAAVVFLAVRFGMGWLDSRLWFLQNAWLPIGIILIDFAGCFIGITGVRGIRRILAERSDERRRATGLPGERVRTILIGAGQAGLLVAKELAQRPDLGLRPVGFLDDDPQKFGTELHGLRVLGSTRDLAEVCQKHGASQALITIANASGKDIRRISEICRKHGIPTKIVPGIYEIVGGKVNLSRIRELEIEDLLGREPVELDMSALRDQLRGRVVLVTGAGGSIGSELCRQVCQFEPTRLILLEQAENALFHIHRELTAAHPHLEIVPCMADVCDASRMRSVMGKERPDVVLHAAAHKHVPMMEWNPGEAIKNNVFGTVLVADLAHELGVSVFVLISTDKAVNPTSMMGASKRIAEIYAQSLARKSRTRFVTVRFGNVLGSAGSVIPIFKDQIARGGPVTVTHPEMRRYFMTIPEACQLVLQAGTMGRGGEIFILDMGEPIKIVDLARDMIQLSGLVPGEDIEIQFSGIRPGEKLFEELSVSAEHADRTRHPKIFVGRGQARDLEDVLALLERLRALCDTGSVEQLREAVAALVPEYEYPGKRAAAPVQPAAAVPAARQRRASGAAMALPHPALARVGTERN